MFAATPQRQRQRYPVSLVFTTGADPFQFFIKVGTRSPATHAAIGVGDKLLHAYEDGVKLDPRSAWFGDDRQALIAEFMIVPDVSQGVQLAAQHIGRPYDVVGIVKAALLRGLAFCASPVQSFGPATDNAHVCASFAMLLDPYGIQIPEWRAIDRANVSPADLLAAARGPSFRRVA